MARQPRRSAFVLARNQKNVSRSFTIVNNSRRKKRSRSIDLPARQLFIFPLIVLLVFGIVLDSHAYDSTLSLPSLVATRNIAVGSGSPDPKFGERLLPRSKQLIGPQSNLSVNRNNQLNISNSSNKNVRNSVGYSDNIESSSPVNENLIGSSSFSSEAPSSSPLSAARQSQVNLQRRQGKQLYRRNDDNIDDEGAQEPNDGAGGYLEDSIAANLTAAHNVNESRADRLEMSTEFFIIPSTTAASSIATVGPMRPMGKARASLSGPAIVQQQQNNLGHGPRHVLVLAPKSAVTSNASVTPPTILSIHHQNGLRKEPWVIPVLVLASLTMIMMAAFEIFVLFKAWRTSPSRRHLFLGQMLLLGLFACAGLGAIITGQPTVLSCGAIRFGVGVAYALVFAALLVKCVFLISLNGGVYLPAPYQGLLLLFAVLIQVAIGSQWLMTQPPEIYTMPVPATGSGYMAAAAAAAAATSNSGSGGAAFSTSSISFFREMKFAQSSSSSSSSLSPSASDLIAHHGGGAPTLLISLCKTQFSELLFSLIYIVFLIVFVAVLAIKSRGIRDNYREATYIGLAIGGAIPIWLGWMLCGLAVADRHKDACIAFGLVATSATVFLVMFMPKGRQLAAMGKEGLYVEDREEQFSSLSRAGSGYSPSFFHFKPIKYGVMGAMPNSASNTGNGNSIKHHSNGLNGGGGGGDRVALVTAAPPSYTRMYHYFPAHLTHPFCFYPQPPPPPPPQLPPPMPPTLKALGNSITSMTQAHLAQTLRYPGLFIRPDETNLYTTLEPTLSSNPNVYFQRGGGVHPGMMY